MNNEGGKMVLVTRQKNGFDATIEVPLSEVSGLHAGTWSGGYQEGHFYPELYAYMSCGVIPDGSGFGHSGSHGPCPHRIKVCIIGAPDDSLYRSLRQEYGVEAPTDEQIDEDRGRLKREIIQRLGATEAATGGLEEPKRGVAIFSSRLENEVGPLLQAWAGESDWSDWYFDRATGEVFLDAGDPDVLPNAWNRYVDRTLDAEPGSTPPRPDRFERLESFRDREIDLLTIADLREIRDAFLKSRGFKPPE